MHKKNRQRDTELVGQMYRKLDREIDGKTLKNPYQCRLAKQLDGEIDGIQNQRDKYRKLEKRKERTLDRSRQIDRKLEYKKYLLPKNYLF